MFGACFVTQCLVSFLVLQPSHRERDSRLLYFNCAIAVVWLLVFSVFSSRYHGLFCEYGFPGHTYLS